MAKVGSRWDDEIQNERTVKAKKMGLVEFVEINYPIADGENPYEVELPFYAHSANNPLCSAFGFDQSLIEMVKREADLYDSPWVGEHLSWLSFESGNALGYVFNSIYSHDFFEIACENVSWLQSYYNRPLALELGPQYQVVGDFSDEIDFLIGVSKRTGAHVILDLSHQIISNHNLGRSVDYGLDRLFDADTIEVHVSGIRKSQSSKFWHDCHDVLPNETTLTILKDFVTKSRTVKAVTFEHSSSSSEKDFLQGLENIHGALV